MSLRLERRRRPMSEETVGTTEYDPDTYSKLIEEVGLSFLILFEFLEGTRSRACIKSWIRLIEAKSRA